MEYKSVRPSQVLLDPQNPRLPDGTSNDKEAINRLLAEGFDQLVALARDLVERGEGNPTELPIISKDGSKFVVLEGNRRFAALKLLADPKWADDPAHQQAFARIGRRGKTPPKYLYCAVAESREDADHWITLRHTGANNGVGVRTWSAEQNARHRQRMRAPVDSGTLRSIAIADELTEAYQSDDELVALIKHVRTEKLTNIGRFFSGVTLTRMQFELRQVASDDPATLWAWHTADELHAYFKWALDFLSANSVDAFKNDQIRGGLLNDNAALIPDASASLAEPRRLADYPFSSSNATETVGNTGTIGAGGPGTDSGDDPADDRADGANDTSAGGAGESDDGEAKDYPEAGKRRDQKDERAIYSQVRLTNLSPNVQRLLREARQLAIVDNYAIACVLARVILELAVSDPKVLAWSGAVESGSLESKIKACILTLDPEIDAPRKRTRQDLVQAHLEASGIGVNYLHQFMHNPSAKADAQLARRFSSAFTPLLMGINEVIR